MARVSLAPRADRDVAEIVGYLSAAAGARVADKYIDLFDALAERLSVYPETGAPRPRWGARTRIGIVEPYLVIYDYAAASDSVVVLRILHGHRRITKRLVNEAR